ncbi:MAG TPA: response regulator transcription factor [Verrucomicrobiae bacterium]
MKTKSPSTASKRKRILLVEDHPLMREAVALWIRRAPDLDICGEAESANTAISLVSSRKPDLVLTDISLRGRSGLEMVKDLAVQHPGLPVLVLSMHEESLYAGRALRAGARGYIMKRAGGARLIEAIREVLQGGIAVSPETLSHLLEGFAGKKTRSSRTTLSHLTDREFEILQLIGEAKSNREIAAELHISAKTVETHCLNLMDKLKFKKRAALLRFALQYGSNGS